MKKNIFLLLLSLCIFAISCEKETQTNFVEPKNFNADGIALKVVQDDNLSSQLKNFTNLRILKM